MRSAATPRRMRRCPVVGSGSRSCVSTRRSAVSAACTRGASATGTWRATHASTRSTSASSRASASVCAAGSLQSMSSAALRLGAPSSVTPAPRSTWARGTFSVVAAHVTTVPSARPRRFHVSSTRPAPTNGDESSAARNACHPNRPVCFASATVRSSSFRSRSCAIIRSRNFTSAPCENGASVAPRHPSTNCHRWSTRAVITASASPTWS